ncbi:NTP transferase domain-containing protein, partial [Klebsiella pneumoniae]|uniref:NTP transferase domain-containing protein n=1 Tax=Klebsiella pneumoniae TaxID=573 RepID=UPI003EE1F5A0
RFRAAGFEEPKPLVPVRGRPMIERLLDAFPADWPTTFVLAENHRSTRLPAVLAALRPEGKQLHVPVHREGPGRALAAALDHLDPA